MRPPLRPLRVLAALLDTRGRRRLALAAFVQLVDRLALTASAVFLTSRGVGVVILVLLGLGAVLLLRSAARALLAVHARAQVIQALTSALLSSQDGIGETSDETELSLVDAMYAGEDILRQRLPDLIGDVPACVILAAFVVVREPWAVVLEWASVVVAGGAAVALVRNVTATHVQRAWRAFLPALDELLTAIHARSEVLGNGDERRLLRDLAVKLDAWKRRSGGAGMVSFLAGRAPVAAAAVAAAMVFAFGGWHEASLAWGVVLASVIPPFAGVARGTLDLTRDVVRAAPLVAVLSAAPRHRDDGRAEVELPADVTWADVSFTYAEASQASVAGVDLTWRPRTLLGLAGENGSGKSTLARLLLGLHAPTAGAVHIGGTSLADLDMAALRRRVGYLPQRPYLPERMTVGEVVRRLSPDASDDAMRSSLARLGLLGILERRQPNAPLDVKVGSLSAGEKQRVALCRVLVRDARLLVLDEPDASLDAEGVTSLGDLLRQEAASRMVLVIAHNPALLARCDRIIRLEGGRLVSDASPSVSPP